VIVNLAVNARDAMLAGGRLTIEPANVELDAEYAQGHAEVDPGPYVVLSVTDTGTGMDEATRARLFEPFYTTKTQGTGTGLGLATVYGIVKQSGGHVWVYSEPGRGTVFKVYLPRVEAVTGERVTPELRPATRRDRVDPGRGGRRQRTRVRPDCPQGPRLPRPRGGKRDDAVRLAVHHDGPIGLILTDVVMPGMSRPDLAVRIREIVPGVKVLFVSGYTENTIVHHGVLDPRVSFLAMTSAAVEIAGRGPGDTTSESLSATARGVTNLLQNGSW
jgi:CheY-like chemotaxis protein